MRLLRTCLFALIFSGSGLALEIDISDFPQAGVRVAVEVDTAVAFSVQSLTQEGAAQTWHLNQALEVVKVETLKVQTAEASIYRNVFPDADLSYLSGIERLQFPKMLLVFENPVDTLVQSSTFLQLNGNRVDGVGMELIIPPFFHDPIRFYEKSVMFDFPLSVGKSWLSFWQADSTIQTEKINIYVFIQDSTVVLVDAEGELSLSGETYSALRLRSIWQRRVFLAGSEDKEKIEVPGLGDSRIIYRWFVPEIGYVMEVRSKKNETDIHFTQAAQMVRAVGVELPSGCVDCENQEFATLPLPQKVHLSGNFPNPFNNATRIDFELSVEADVHLGVFNLLGQEIRTLVSQPLSRGSHVAIWNGRNQTGAMVPSGVYLCRLQVVPKDGSKTQVLVDKMILTQ